MADQIQGGGPTSSLSSFLGADVSSDTSASEPTVAETSVDSVGDSSLASGDTPDTSTGESDGVEQETESLDDGTEVQAEDDADYLPDEQAKVFPVEELAKYGKRYGYTLEEIQSDPRLQNALKDKINSDIQIAKQKAQATEEVEAEDEPTVEPETHSDEQTAELQQKHLAQLEAFADRITTPEMAKAFAEEIDKAYGGEGKVDPKVASATAKAFTKFGTNLMMSALPQLLLSADPQTGKTMLDAIIETRYPDFGDMHEKTFYARTWESVRESNPEYQNLPQYGPKGSEFEKTLMAAAAKIPNFDATYAHLPLAQRARAQYALLASVAAGNKPTPAVIQQAQATAKKQAEDAGRKRNLGKALASGQSKKEFAPERSESPMAEGHRLWQERESNVFQRKS